MIPFALIPRPSLHRLFFRPRSFRRIPRAMSTKSELSSGASEPVPDSALPPDDHRIYVLGSGNIGCLVAHSLRCLPAPPPVTLLFHKYSTLQKFISADATIKIQRPHKELSTSKGFDYELTPAPNVVQEASNLSDQLPLPPPPPPPLPPQIAVLIITTKAPQAVAALRPISERLTRDSTILILQNGMGVLDEIKSEIFPDPSSRPNFILGITTHGIYPQGPFTLAHRGLGSISLGYVQRDVEPSSDSGSWLFPSLRGSKPSPHTPEDPDKPPPLESLPPTASYLFSQFLSSPGLTAVHLPLAELLSAQLEKLAVNAVINPLTVLLDCRNGELLNNYFAVQTMRIILWEVSQVLCALPELEAMPGRDMRLSPDRLYDLVISVARLTGGNYSSMFQDVREGKQTEIDYINGYIVEQAKKLELACTMNFMLISLVKGKAKIQRARAEDAIPFAGT